MAIAIGDALTIRVVVRVIEQAGANIGVSPVSDQNFYWFAPPHAFQDSAVAAPRRDEPAPANPAMPRILYGQDELMALLLKRLAAHASTPAAVLPMDYGRIEELCWLIRWVMSDGALPA